jgi:hypothetical protein
MTLLLSEGSLAGALENQKRHPTPKPQTMAAAGAAAAAAASEVNDMRIKQQEFRQ